MKLWLTLLILSIYLTAQPGIGLAGKVETLKKQVEENGGMLLDSDSGKISQSKFTRSFSLDRNRNYRIFLVFDREPSDFQAECVVEGSSSHKRRTSSPDGTEYHNISCYHWFLMTFSSRLKVEIKFSKARDFEGIAEYAILICSAGRGQWQPCRRMSDGFGNVYELQEDNRTVFRNGRKAFDIRKYEIAHLCVTQHGTVFLITTEGYVLRQNALLIKRSGRKAVWMVGGKQDSLYILFADGSVYNRSGQLVYLRHQEHTAVDLVEDNSTVWVITKEGERIEMYSPTRVVPNPNPD